MRKPNQYNQVITILQELHKAYPTYNLGRHLSLALGDYQDLWGVSDKEIVFALNKYKAQLEMEEPFTEEDVSEIIKDGMNLNINTLLNGDEDDD